MMGKFLILNFKFLILITIILFFLLYPNPYTLPPTYADQSCLLQTTNAQGDNIARVTGGLISASGFVATGNKFGSNTGQCALGNQIPFVPYKLDTYDAIKSRYFDQAKLRSNQIITLTGTQIQNPATTAIDLVSLPNLCSN